MSTTDPTVPEPRQFLIRLPHWGWLLLTTVALVAGSIGASVWLPYRREQQAIQKIENWGGSVETEKGDPEWLRQLVDEDRMQEINYFERVVTIKLKGTPITNADIALLCRLPSLRELHLDDTTVTDSGLSRLSSLTNLQELHLENTAITDAGLAHLSGCTNLTYLCLDGTKLTDAGLAHLTKLTKLQHLYLNDTAVTDAGLVHLRRATNLEYLQLNNTSVTDKGIAGLKVALTACIIQHR